MPQPWRRVSSQVVVDSPWLRLRADAWELPDGHVVEPYYVQECADWVAVVALTAADEVVLCDEFRPGAARVVRGLPGGMVEAGEQPTAAAARELAEETGYVAKHVVEVGIVSPNPASYTNSVHVCLALECLAVGGRSLDDGEDIGVVLAPWSEVSQPGYLTSALHAAALFHVEAWRRGRWAGPRGG